LAGSFVASGVVFRLSVLYAVCMDDIFKVHLLPSELLSDAIEIIEDRGWRQYGNYDIAIKDGDLCGRVCMMGACSAAVSLAGSAIIPYFQNPFDQEPDNFREATEELVAQVNGRVPQFWNDNEGRTKEEVITLLNKARVALEARGR